MEITKREAIFSIIIVSLMLVLGILISAKIDDYNVDEKEKYIKAIDITNKEMFEHGIKTNIGNVFIYGEIKAVDSVSYPLLNEKYIYIQKTTEEYTKHTRQVSHKDSKGRTYYTTETYWTWDEIDYEEKECKNITILGMKFKRDIVNIGVEYIDTIDTGHNLREVYYGIPDVVEGTIFANLQENTIKYTNFYENRDIQSVRESLESEDIFIKIIFWIFWIILTIGAVYGFVFLDNKWLEN